MRHSWIDDLRAVTLAEAAARLGIEIRGRYARPCPACGRDRRGSTDPRGPVSVSRDGRSWHCQRCDAGGGTLELASWALLGRLVVPGDRDGWARLRDWWGAERPAAAPVSPPAHAAPVYPPPAEVEALWAQCGPLDRDPETWAWLRDVRRFLRDPAERIADYDLARALPPGADCPRWARTRAGTWAESGHRLVVPLYSPDGRMRSVLARHVPEGGAPKSLAPAGYDRAGLVMADALGLQVLASGWPGLWDRDCRRIVVAEGEMDWLRWATVCCDAESDRWPAVVGLVQGAWAPEVAEHVPDGSELVVCLDIGPDGEPDAGARKILDRIRATVAGRCPLRLWRPPCEVS